MPSNPTAIWWIRRDLRLRDNPALTAAARHAQTVLPLFILDPAILKSTFHAAADKRKSFLFDGLRALDADLRALGSRLVVRQGRPEQVLIALVEETGATAIFAGEDFSPYARRRDALVTRAAPLTLVNSLNVHPPDLVVKADGKPYTIYTPFRRAWRSLPLPAAGDVLPAPEKLRAPPGLGSLDVPTAAAPTYFLPGEAHAQSTLAGFAGAAIFEYAHGRSRLDGDGTSALSPYLRFGMISAREVVVAAQQAIAAAASPLARKSAEAWLDELIWREFYNAILYHFPEVLRTAFRPKLRGLPWTNDRAAFDAWCEGRTGYPVVDAAMRQLAFNGWVHNRARMIAASFLVKDLLVDWRWGERWFMRHLLDGDLAANNGGWQWTAGVGTDAAPYFRIFNPVLQAKRHDPQGDFVRAWLPELRRVPDKFIHEPWKMPEDVQRRARCEIGRRYPPPIVNHAEARRRALELYRQPVLTS